MMNILSFDNIKKTWIPPNVFELDIKRTNDGNFPQDEEDIEGFNEYSP